jgi:hypothetical protein
LLLSPNGRAISAAAAAHVGFGSPPGACKQLTGKEGGIPVDAPEQIQKTNQALYFCFKSKRDELHRT